ncbi:Sec23 protein transport family protein [Klebsormidium nitens]|uniref:Protein transport protein SEC23 n=1 Tax=Klebsormidium nitens TaxID=105231 RepID=A0A1Y1HTG0_KLENI|nr:Sec23 protein transport family protein [Klebsormidium nitens]|eukprot:GAQ79816.1 Sec23 protein transport family protein [Klebsormidium nitens]
MDFQESEALDGLRFSWNVWPSSRIEATRMVVPFGVIVTPLHKLEGMPVLPYEPVTCKGCSAVLNPYCRVDFQARIWVCPFCYQRNHFPQHYHGISEQNLPAELYSTYSTVEYGLATPPSGPPAFLFVVDTCQPEEDLQGVRDALTQALSLLPESALVGLVTFGTMVQVHELKESECPRSYVFRGDKEVSADEVAQLLGITLATPQQPPRGAPAAAAPFGGAPGVGRFLLPISECEYTLTTALEEIRADPWGRAPNHRPLRSTGAALGVAVGLMEKSVPNVGSRIMLFLSGPCTNGPGIVVDPDLSFPMRSHQDFEKDNTMYYKRAVKYFNGLGGRMVNNGHVLDIFACSLDQVGLAEAKNAVDSTGGLMVMAEEFTNEIFKKSLQRMLQSDEQGNLNMAFNASMEVLTTKEVKISGAIGPVSSLKKKSACVGEGEIGIGGTSQWKICSLNSKTAVAVYFEVVNQHSSPVPEGQVFFLQFVTQYQHSSGQRRLRVCTTARRWVEGQDNTQELAAGFDQEAAAVLMARLAVFKTEHEDAFDILRWLDRMLIRLGSKFGEFQKDDAASFRLSANFSIYPQFMFHLRRSQFLQVFNNSPDETAFFRLMLNREGVLGSLIMIQPTLLSYSFDGPPVPVLLDVSSIGPDRILLLDSYFNVVVHYGATIAQWRKLGYQNDPAHEHFKKLLETPVQDAEAFIADRCPIPKVIECDQGGSQARFLLAKLNPSATHNSQQFGQGEVIFTDDVSLQVFTDHLARLAVQS